MYSCVLRINYTNLDIRILHTLMYLIDLCNTDKVLQADIVYERDKELRVVSLEGLQYLYKQKQILSSRYPNREVRLAHMISFNLRPVILSAYNSYRYNASQLTGNDPEEVILEDWLSLSNSTVSEILLEAVRPRTKEKSTMNASLLS